MLILTRRIGEAVVIGNDGKTQVRLLAIKGHQVRIGIEAPADVPVHREEIFQRIALEKAAAADPAELARARAAARAAK